MTNAFLEHVNITVSDPARTTKMLEDIFGWHIRWSGPSALGGESIHVGTDTHYIAVYSREKLRTHKMRNGAYVANLNHIAIVVDDLDATEKRVKEAGYEPHNHADYEPGKRFYFHDHDGIEFEVVNYG